MSLSQFLQSHDLVHLSDNLARAGYTDLSSLRLLALNEESLDALNLVSREAKKLAAAISQIPTDRNLPTILTLPLAEFEREQNPVLALWAMCDFAELTLKLLVMAAAAEHEVLPEAVAAVFHKRIERPTLGGWHDMARVAVENLAAGSVLPMLPPAFKALSKLVGLESQGPDKSLLCVRNRLAHGRPTRAEAAEWLKVWRRPISGFVDKSIDWLAETRFVAVDEGGRRCLLQGEIGSEFQADTPIPQDAPAGSAWLLIEENALDLGLLAAFDFENRAPLVYMRSQDVSLQYLRIAATGGAWESNIREWTAFQSRFLKTPKLAATRTVRLFDEEIHREAQRRVGRERELLQLWEAVAQMERGCIWIGGAAGIGKSNLMASLMQRLRESPPENVLVLPYRFRAQDDRNSRGAFLSYFREQLDFSDLVNASESQSPSAAGVWNPVNEIMERLDRLNPRQRVLLVVDGLDEIMQHDERFVEDALLCFVPRGVVVVGAGRPEFGLQESFRQRKAFEPFSDGLGAMTQEDVRSMLFDRLFGEARRGVLLSDREEGGKVENTFIEQVASRSEGLPIYVNYVIGDISAKRIRPDNANDLPRGIHAYHAELLRRCSTGDLQAVVTPMLVVVALAHEPLSEEEITALLKRFGRLETMNLSLVGRGLALLGSMLRRSTKSNGKGGITVYHDSLRSHILQDLALAETVASTKRGFANESTKPGGDAAKDYLYRNGVNHLLEAGRFNHAVRLQTDFEFLMARFRTLEESGQAAADWYADWDRLRKSGDLEGDAQVWWDFARTHRHYFFAKGWEAWRVLFQAAMDHADDSPVTIAAEGFLAIGKVDWIWLRCINRPQRWIPSPLQAIMVAHEDRVIDSIQLADGLIVSTSSDKTLRLWDYGSGNCIAVLKGHAACVLGARQLKDGRVLSWSHDKTLRIWDIREKVCQAILVGHADSVTGAIQLHDGNILSWSHDNTPSVWSLHTGECSGILHGHEDSVTGMIQLEDGRLISSSLDGTLRLWELDSRECQAVLYGHKYGVWNPIDIGDGFVLARTEVGTILVWDVESGECRSSSKRDEHVVWDVLKLRSGCILTCSDDCTLRIWDGKTGECHAILKGHENKVSGAIELQNGQVLSWSHDGTLRVWDVRAGECRAVLKGHEGSVSGAIELTDGSILCRSYDRTLYILAIDFNESKSFDNGSKDLVDGTIKISDGCILSWSNKTMRIWNADFRECSAILKGHESEILEAIELRNGSVLSRCYRGDDTLRIWNPQTGECYLILKGHKNGGVMTAVELGDGKLLAGYADGTLRIWDHRGKCRAVLKGHTDCTYGALELRNRNVLSWSSDCTLRVWDYKTGKCRAVLIGHESDVWGAVELQNGRVLSWSNDETLRIWDSEDWECLAILKGHKKFVTGAIELRNGRVLSWSGDETLRIWDGQTGECRAVLKGHENDIAGAIELTDGRIFSWGSNKTIHAWNLVTGLMETWNSPKDWTLDQRNLMQAQLPSFPFVSVEQFDLKSNFLHADFRATRCANNSTVIRGRLLIEKHETD